MDIKILGGGCPNCIILYNNVVSVCKEMDIEPNIEKITDYENISKYNVMSTPALVINEKVVGFGKLKYKKIKELINNA